MKSSTQKLIEKPTRGITLTPRLVINKLYHMKTTKELKKGDVYTTVTGARYRILKVTKINDRYKLLVTNGKGEWETTWDSDHEWSID